MLLEELDQTFLRIKSRKRESRRKEPQIPFGNDNKKGAFSSQGRLDQSFLRSQYPEGQELVMLLSFR